MYATIKISHEPEFIGYNAELFNYEQLCHEIESGVLYEYPEAKLDFEENTPQFKMIEVISNDDEFEQYILNCIENLDLSEDKYYQ